MSSEKSNLINKENSNEGVWCWCIKMSWEAINYLKAKLLPPKIIKLTSPSTAMPASLASDLEKKIRLRHLMMTAHSMSSKNLHSTSASPSSATPTAPITIPSSTRRNNSRQFLRLNAKTRKLCLDENIINEIQYQKELNMSNCGGDKKNALNIEMSDEELRNHHLLCIKMSCEAIDNLKIKLSVLKLSKISSPSIECTCEAIDNLKVKLLAFKLSKLKTPVAVTSSTTSSSSIASTSLSSAAPIQQTTKTSKMSENSEEIKYQKFSNISNHNYNKQNLIIEETNFEELSKHQLWCIKMTCEAIDNLKNKLNVLKTSKLSSPSDLLSFAFSCKAIDNLKIKLLALKLSKLKTSAAIPSGASSSLLSSDLEKQFRSHSTNETKYQNFSNKINNENNEKPAEITFAVSSSLSSSSATTITTPSATSQSGRKMSRLNAMTRKFALDSLFPNEIKYQKLSKTSDKKDN